MMEERDRRSSGSGWHHPTPTPALEILLATSSFIKTNKSLLIEAKVSQEFSYFLSQYMQACDDLKHLEFHNRFCHVKKVLCPSALLLSLPSWVVSAPSPVLCPCFHFAVSAAFLSYEQNPNAGFVLAILQGYAKMGNATCKI